jgi:hypothetical protein
METGHYYIELAAAFVQGKPGALGGPDRMEAQQVDWVVAEEFDK